MFTHVSYCDKGIRLKLKLENNTQQTTQNKKTKTAKQRQILKQIRTQLPLADGTFISHSVYKFWGKLNCKIVNTLW